MAESIDFHPKVACGGEWTLPVAWYRKLQVTERIFAGDFSVLLQRQQQDAARMMTAQPEWLGFRALFRSSTEWFLHPRTAPALWLDRLEAYVRWLAKRPAVRVLHIVRCDSLAWLRSRFVSSKSGVFNTKPYPTGLRVTILPSNAMARLRSKEWVDSRLSSLAATNPYLRIYYEDFLAEPEKVVDSMLSFLNCDSREVVTRARKNKKQSSERLDDQILNYHELIDALKRHDLRWSGLCDGSLRERWADQATQSPV